MKKYFFLGWFTAAIVLGLWFWLGWHLPSQVSETPGQWGDQFGAVNSFFTGVAVVGAISALLLQIYGHNVEAEHRHEEEKHRHDTAKDTKRQVELTAVTARVNGLTALLNATTADLEAIERAAVAGLDVTQIKERIDLRQQRFYLRKELSKCLDIAEAHPAPE